MLNSKCFASGEESLFLRISRARKHFWGFFWRKWPLCVKMPKKYSWRSTMNERPSWVDCNGVVELAETLAANKDMLRVDRYLRGTSSSRDWFESGGRRSIHRLYPNVRFIRLLFYVIQPFLRRLLDRGLQVIRLEIIVLFQAIKSQKSFSRLECCLRTVSCTVACFRPRRIR